MGGSCAAPGLPAFNCWCDLASYSSDTMEAALREEELQIRENDSEGPVVLVNEQDGGLEANGGEMILQFMERNGYELTLQNDRFTIYETATAKQAFVLRKVYGW